MNSAASNRYSVRATTCAALGVLALSMMSCGDADATPGPPTVTLEPSGDVTFVFHNTTEKTIYVDWTLRGLAPTILRDGAALKTELGCLTPCEETCECKACPVSEPKARRVRAGETITAVWRPVHYYEHKCEEQPSCACAQEWPVTAGRYEVKLMASTALLEGTPAPADPNLILGGKLVEPRDCTGQAPFSIAATTDVRVVFACGSE